MDGHRGFNRSIDRPIGLFIHASAAHARMVRGGDGCGGASNVLLPLLSLHSGFIRPQQVPRKERISFFFPPTRLIVFVAGRERRKPCALPRRLFLFYDRCFNRSRSPSSVTAPMAVIGGGERRSGGVSTAAELRTGKTYALCSSPPPPKQMPVCVHYYYACTHAPSGDGTGWSE